MPKIIAVAGKGGTGKTTTASLITRVITGISDSVLVIDADPNSNTWQALGCESPRTIMDIVEAISGKTKSVPAGMTKDRFIQMEIQTAIAEGAKFDLLSMGRPEGPGCYCYANNLLRDVIERTAGAYDYVIADNEAGMEHMSRRLMRRIDNLYVISDNSIVGIRSAGNISGIADGLGLDIKRRDLVVNKSSGASQTITDEIAKTGLNAVASIPYDNELETIAVKGGSVFDLSDEDPALMAVRDILSRTGVV